MDLKTALDSARNYITTFKLGDVQRVEDLALLLFVLAAAVAFETKSKKTMARHWAFMMGIAFVICATMVMLIKREGGL